MEITIAGYGFVGKAHAQILKEYYDINIADPILLETTVSDYVDETEAVICCVSTPQADDGSCDMTNVYNVIENVPWTTPILIKSTISLEGWDYIKNNYPDHSITFSPEFLVAATAYEDFRNTKHLYLGGDGTALWTDVFSNVFSDVTYEELTVPELIMIKYGRNTFLATKVAYFNQLHDVCAAKNINFDKVAAGIGQDNRIGTSHTQITAQRGFGGHCFPKDTSAMLTTSKLYTATMSILESAVVYNNKIRK